MRYFVIASQQSAADILMVISIYALWSRDSCDGHVDSHLPSDVILKAWFIAVITDRLDSKREGERRVVERERVCVCVGGGLCVCVIQTSCLMCVLHDPDGLRKI